MARAPRAQTAHNRMVTLVLLTVIAVIVVASYFVQSSRDSTGKTTTPPSGAVQTYGVPRGKTDAPVKLTVYEDFMCPICGELESATRSWLPQYVDDGKVSIVYRPVSFLDRMSGGTHYSTRATNAYAVVLDVAGPEVAAKFHDLLFENQPQEGSDGLTDDQLVAYAGQAGADESAVRSGIDDETFEQWVVNGTDDASKKHDVTGTPTVEVNGTRLPALQPDELATVLHQTIDRAIESS